MAINHKRTISRTDIDGTVFILMEKSMIGSDGSEYSFLSLVKGNEVKIGNETVLTVRKNYTIPIKCAKWLGEKLVENFKE